MANAEAWTGNGTVAALTTQSEVWEVISIEGFEEMLPDINNSDLSTTGHEAFIAGDLLEHNELVLNVAWNPANQGALTVGTVDVLTITYPISHGSAQATNATLAGQGWVKGWSIGEVANNQRIEGTIVWRFEGGNATGPITWTDQSA